MKILAYNRNHSSGLTVDDVVVDLLEEMQWWPVNDSEIDEALMASIHESGVMQSLTVSQITGENVLQLIGGRRRFKALQAWRRQGVVIKFNAEIMFHRSREDAKNDCMLINMQESQPREVPDWIDMAERIDSILQQGKSYKDIANVLGQTVPYIKSIHRLLQLPEEVQQMVKEKKLTLSHARTLQQRVPADEILERARQAQHWTLTALMEFLDSAYPA